LTNPQIYREETFKFGTGNYKDRGCAPFSKNAPECLESTDCPYSECVSDNPCVRTDDLSRLAKILTRNGLTQAEIGVTLDRSRRSVSRLVAKGT